MRLWTIHPKYLDSKGLVAVWREGLLAQKVLAGATRGYRNHPQLERFKASSRALESMAVFLSDLQAEASRRGYAFDASKIGVGSGRPGTGATAEGNVVPAGAALERIPVTSGQIDYEFELLKTKLEIRDRAKLAELLKVETIALNAAFEEVAGEVAPWERAMDAVLVRTARHAQGSF
jgi:hypothetical protein